VSQYEAGKQNAMKARTVEDHFISRLFLQKLLKDYGPPPES
jgi:hypothetical protein